MTPFWRIVTGKTLEGAVVNHILKSLLQFSDIVSKIYSNFGINEAAKWQFYKKIHLPYSIPSYIAAQALSPYPYPKDLIINFEFMLNLEAKFSTSTLGSAPVERTNIKGVWQLESSYAPYRSKGGNST